jgi:hypothetical protein
MKSNPCKKNDHDKTSVMTERGYPQNDNTRRVREIFFSPQEKVIRATWTFFRTKESRNTQKRKHLTLRVETAVSMSNIGDPRATPWKHNRYHSGFWRAWLKRDGMPIQKSQAGLKRRTTIHLADNLKTEEVVATRPF